MMQTRTKQHIVGFYLKSKKALINLPIAVTNSQKIPKTKIFRETIIEREMKFLNTKLLAKCTSTTKKSPLIRGDMEINTRILNFLKIKFDLTGRYKSGKSVAKFFSFETKRAFNETCILFVFKFLTFFDAK